MNLIFSENINNIVDRIGYVFYENPYFFLTEEDVRIHLAAKLLEECNMRQDTADGEFSIPVHGEVRWYGNNKNLNIRSDIVLIDTQTLRVKHDRGFNLPSKGYGFSSALAVFEIKLRRPKYDSTDVNFIRKIEKDIEKLRTIKNMYMNNPMQGGYWMVIMDQKGNINRDIERLQNSGLNNDIKIKYFCHAR